MRVALVQQRAAGADPAANLERGIALCERAAGEGADLVVFPELWSIGFTPCPSDPRRRDRWLALAVDAAGPWVTAFQETAARLDLAIVPTFLRAVPGGAANAAALVDHRGRLVTVYDKVHICDFTWERVLVPGAGFTAATLDTAAGSVRTGVLICFDREFPEAARTLALDGAELMVCPNACLICDDRLGQVRTRAFENMAALAMANYPLPVANGRSCVFDGRAVENGRPRDHRVVVAGPVPGLVCADLDLDALRAYRATGIWGAAHRRPGAYGTLAAPAAGAKEGAGPWA